jgi:Cu/Ag efflux pump CusA
MMRGIVASSLESQFLVITLAAVVMGYGVSQLRDMPVDVLRGARERLAPELMTTLTTGLAHLPFALFGGVPGHEPELDFRPVAVAA